MALDTQNLTRYRGANLVGQDGEKIGSIDEIYLDDRTGQPEWALVNTGLFGLKSTFVPLANASVRGDDLAVGFDKETVKGAPKIDPDGHLSESEERELYRYYGMDYETGYDQPSYYGEDRTDTVGRDVSGPTTDDAMTLSEEQVNVGTREQEVGRARLRKYIVTENVQQTVPVSREEVRLEREPITDANRGAAYAGPELSEEEHEVTLHEEVPVVDKDVRATERVRLDTDRVTDEARVSEDVRREEVELDESGVRRDQR